MQQDAGGLSEFRQASLTQWEALVQVSAAVSLHQMWTILHVNPLEKS